MSDAGAGRGPGGRGNTVRCGSFRHDAIGAFGSVCCDDGRCDDSPDHSNRDDNGYSAAATDERVAIRLSEHACRCRAFLSGDTAECRARGRKRSDAYIARDRSACCAERDNTSGRDASGGAGCSRSARGADRSACRCSHSCTGRCDASGGCGLYASSGGGSDDAAGRRASCSGRSRRRGGTGCAGRRSRRSGNADLARKQRAGRQQG